jgi:hypothetical protein
LAADSSTELREETEVVEGDSLGESAGDTMVELATLDMAESAVMVLWTALLGGRADVVAAIVNRGKAYAEGQRRGGSRSSTAK